MYIYVFHFLISHELTAAHFGNNEEPKKHGEFRSLQQLPAAHSERCTNCVIPEDLLECFNSSRLR
jgi:hypothetical protein